MAVNESNLDNPYAPPKSDLLRDASGNESVRGVGKTRFSILICCWDLLLSIVLVVLACGSGAELFKIVRHNLDTLPKSTASVSLSFLIPFAISTALLGILGLVGNLGLLLRKRWAILPMAVKSILLVILSVGLLAASLSSVTRQMILFPLMIGAYGIFFLVELYRYNRRLAEESSHRETSDGN